MSTFKKVSFALLLMLPLCAHAWGPQGHALVGAIADANLTPAAKAAVTALLKNDLLANGKPSGRTTLAEVASWPDEIRSTPAGQGNAAWHFRDNPICGDALQPCPNGNCVDKKIADMQQILASSTADQRSRNEALKWLVHLIGDIHQPIHTGSNHDEGGNEIQVLLPDATVPLSLHKAWDSAFVKSAAAKGKIEATLPPQFKAKTISDWMTESHALAVNAVYGKLPGFSCSADLKQQPIKIDMRYQRNAEKVVRKQLKLAGLRLADTLNALFH
ncbi:MAG TPA: S1/P1 nuclease [Pseudomonadales bacterium]|nr:S1/P1 nuclease [Pseudomonadales bacterium]